MDASAEIVNPFPSPPIQYNRYTPQNLDLLVLLRERSSTTIHQELQENQHAILSNQADVPEWNLTELERPRADWIIEEGGYNTFGDRWPIPERHPTLEEGGLPQLYPADNAVDHRPAPKKLLNTMLYTYYSMLGALTEPPQPDPTVEPEWHQLTEWIKVITFNMIGTVNELRPVQARHTLELALRAQLANRQQETQAIHAYAIFLFLFFSSLLANTNR
ncbi:hypothetical protein BOTBODRAFT_119857 [Botryobasidium botryosum FD-172 SS1]|uniref:Mediator of RNA polymerase II transcription subunit 7 n=1 Tax=Botryobasidium botryosum (strain FD-172 SS1) TaxID=930990 RepID=A0A067M6U5_BOTB1|nr:hypothetical protein BOTBODRAFT_119857 [Botryobasidium botryosum FD-172 SS1]